MEAVGNIDEEETAPAIPSPAVLLNVTPPRDMIDNETTITITHLLTRQPITLYASLISQKKNTWESWAHYVASDVGKVEVDNDVSIGGTYSGVEPMGLFWSMQPTPGQKKGARLRQFDVMKPRIIDIHVFKGHIKEKFDKCSAVAMATVERWYIKPGVKRIPITEGNVRGTLFLPPGAGPFPLIIDLWGGGGGIIEYKSSLLASHGFAAAVLAYFNHPDLPDLGVDIDYFEEAYDLLCSHPNIDSDNVGALGVSQGVCLCLEMAAESKIKMKCAILTNGGLLRSHLTSIRVGRTLVFQPGSDEHLDIPRDEDGNYFMRYAFNIDELVKEYGEECFVKVENINCPCLFLISGDDPSYQPEEHLQTIYQKMSAVGKQDLVKVLRYPKAGHLLEPPYAPLCPMSYIYVPVSWPATSCTFPILGGPTLFYVLFGGEPKPHAEAQKHSWKSILQFFDENLRCDKSRKGAKL
ncbi:bile acid-CoA:amino acid N-acyltransferase-like [Glandiceps talaboti]